MKVITEQYYHSVVIGILKEREKQIEKLGQPFDGLTADDLSREVENIIGGKWKIKREQSVKFSKADINAVAGARFFKETGQRILMVVAIIILGLSVVVRYIPSMTSLYYNIYYTIVGIVALVFIYVYSRKQSKVRKELWRKLGREEAEEEK